MVVRVGMSEIISSLYVELHRLHTEFPELVAATKPDAGPKFVAELGCGAGNSVFPLLTANENPLLKLHACDFSSHAVKLVQVIESQPAMPVIAASSAKINLCTAQSAVCRSSLGIYQRVSMGSDV